MRHVLFALPLIAGVAWSSAPPADAQPAASYPNKPLRFVVPFPPGGGTDLIARTIGQRLTELWGQAVVIDNRPGAGTNIGTELVAKSPPDGYTLLLASFGHGANISLYRNLPFHPLTSFEMVTLVVTSPNLLVVHPSVPARSVKELIALAKASPGKLNYASFGGGTSAHLAGELFKILAGVDLVHVPYKGSSPALAATIGGEVQLLFSTILSGLRQVEAGKLRGLAVTSARRLQALPNIPTVAETIPGFESGPWYGVMVAARTPRAIVEKLNQGIVAILRRPDVKETFTREGAEVHGSTPEELRSFVKAQIERWAKVVKEAKIRVD